MPHSQPEPLLSVNQLTTHLFVEQGVIKAVSGVSFDLLEGDTVGIVGESGCGKSIMARSIIRLLPRNVGKIIGGSVKYRKGNGEVTDLAKLDPHGSVIRSIRGNEIAMISQEPMTALHPVYTIGQQIVEAVMLHQRISKKDARKRAIEVLGQVGIASPEQRVDDFPHQYSGGMRQRAMIAMALSCNPHLLIADEPTTGLDVTIEAQILDLIRRLQQEQRMALIMITHDLNVVAEVANSVLVMYLGKAVETTTVDDVFDNPRHPYTRGLLRSLPKIGRKERLKPIPGSIPEHGSVPKGCPFATRCPEVMGRCWNDEPPLIPTGKTTHTACWLYEENLEQTGARSE